MAEMATIEILGADELEQIFFALNALDLAAACAVNKEWYAAYQRVRRIPQWVGSLSRKKDVGEAVSEALASAFARIRSRPDMCFVFATPTGRSREQTGNKFPAALAEALRKGLGGQVPVCGCTGQAIVGTGEDLKPTLIEDGRCDALLMLVLRVRLLLLLFPPPLRALLRELLLTPLFSPSAPFSPAEPRCPSLWCRSPGSATSSCTTSRRTRCRRS